MPGSTGDQVVRFGSFEADLREGKLTKAGLRIRLQEQPFQILALLLERPGQLVTREEIRQKLWAQDTFVEFDDGLNTAVRKLRAALGDTADNPRFVETVPRRGYRFVAPVILPQELQRATTHSMPFERSPQVPESSQIPPGSQVRDGRKFRHQRFLWSVAAIFLLATVGTAYWYLRRPAPRVTAKDTIVLADFENTTGEPVFDDSLRQGLEVGLEQSPALNVLSDRKTAVILKQMGHSPDERMTGRTAIDVCQRTGSKVTVQGSISSLGATYLIGLAAIRCDNDEPIAHEQLEVSRKEDVVDGLGKLIARLRERMGESMPSIRKYNAPLEQATTPSLDALKAYGAALSTWDQKGDWAAVPLFQRAIELDPNFAMAYGALATVYENLGETELARQAATKSYELRDRVTESERTSIEARYCLYVTGDLEKANEVYELAVQNYPESAGAFNHLGTSYEALGQYEKAVDSLREAMRLDPTRATTYSNLAADLLALNRGEDAEKVLAAADKQKFQTDFLLQVSYLKAFFRNDQEGMQHALLQSPDVQGAQPLLLSEQADTEAYFGHFQKARELSQVAAHLMQHDGDKESAAEYLAQAALRDAEVGASAQAREALAQAIKLGHGQDIKALEALTRARIGDLKQGQAISEELNRAYPSNTMLQKYWLPTIRAEIDLRQGQWSKAIEDSDQATSFESVRSLPLIVGTLYPAYVRGQAYLEAGDGRKAGTEFQKLIDHRGLVLNFPLASLARLGRARAYSRAGDPAKAHELYQDFFQLWKDADPGLPLLQQAHSEDAKLMSHGT
jgi:DNA-binding winged helix-turn-helix (wHTH) protein/tetratricopeptide (TPR) repeat protein